MKNRHFFDTFCSGMAGLSTCTHKTQLAGHCKQTMLLAMRTMLESQCHLGSPNVDEGSGEYRQLSVTTKALMPAAQHLIGDFPQSAVTEVELERVEIGVVTAKLSTKTSPIITDI